MNSDGPESSQPPVPLPYRRVDPTEWLFVGSFGSVAAWHAAKGVLERVSVDAAGCRAAHADRDAGDLPTHLTDCLI